jgi:GT2 family glycosyltransferase
MDAVDVVIVSYNSATRLERCLTPLCAIPWARPIVVDNASADDSVAVASGLGVDVVERPDNGGFSRGCNAGWRIGDAPFVLFLNPDAAIDEASLAKLVEVLRTDARAGAVAPRLLEEDGALVWSQRRFPRRWTTLAQALFVHRIAGLDWTDDMVRERAAYERPSEPDWVVGACILMRRADLERLDGFDERFFLYREDVDICKRVRDAGLTVRYEPGAAAMHEGRASAPDGAVIPLLAESKVRYARKHHGPVGAALERAAVALHALTHALVGRREQDSRAGYRRSLRIVLRPLPRRSLAR